VLCAKKDVFQLAPPVRSLVARPGRSIAFDRSGVSKGCRMIPRSGRDISLFAHLLASPGCLRAPRATVTRWRVRVLRALLRDWSPQVVFPIPDTGESTGDRVLGSVIFEPVEPLVFTHPTSLRRCA
jgi:hypothetical protein